MAKDNDAVDMHIWKKPETEHMVALFTVTAFKRPICIDMPLADAVRYIRTYMEEEMG